LAYSTGGTVNNIELIGRLGQAPELKHTKSGKAVINISIATNEKSGGEERTSWHRVTFWEKTAEVVNQYCRQGSKVRITGCLVYRDYTDRDGNKRTSAEISGKELTLLDPKPDGTGAGQQRREERPPLPQGQRQKQVPVEDDEDIPF
jgi:single-strand DNA-binding protein